MERRSGVGLRRHAGGCHCGRVRFEVEAPADLELLACNCSICARAAYLHLIVPTPRFHLVSGGEDLTEYRFGTGTARHLFCRLCGVKSFYVPRSHPDGCSVNARCLDPSTIASTTIRPYDGRHWETARRDLDAPSRAGRRPERANVRSSEPARAHRPSR